MCLAHYKAINFNWFIYLIFEVFILFNIFKQKFGHCVLCNVIPEFFIFFGAYKNPFIRNKSK